MCVCVCVCVCVRACMRVCMCKHRQYTFQLESCVYMYIHSTHTHTHSSQTLKHIGIVIFTLCSIMCSIATDLADFTPISNEAVTFEEGETVKTFNVTIINDNVPEIGESVYLQLTNARLVSAPVAGDSEFCCTTGVLYSIICVILVCCTVYVGCWYVCCRVCV